MSKKRRIERLEQQATPEPTTFKVMRGEKLVKVITWDHTGEILEKWEGQPADQVKPGVSVNWNPQEESDT